MASSAFFLTLTMAVTAEAVADTSQGVFHPSFRSLRVTAEGDDFAPPVAMIQDEGSKVNIEFDEIAEDRRFMRYELIHCDARWKPEGLVASEF